VHVRVFVRDFVYVRTCMCLCVCVCVCVCACVSLSLSLCACARVSAYVSDHAAALHVDLSKRLN